MLKLQYEKGVRNISDVKWIKITTDIFDDEKMLLIESLPDADSIIVIWFKLLCLAGRTNNGGIFLMNGKIAYTEKMLATIFRRKESTVTLALKTFEEFGMVEIINDTITIPKWSKHQSLDKLEKKTAYMRNYMAERRRKQKEIAEKANSRTNSKANVSSIDKNREEENREENRIDKDSPSSIQKIHFGKYKNIPLSGNELLQLKSELPDFMDRLEALSEWIHGKGAKCNNYPEMIRKWTAKKPNSFNDYEQRKYDPEELKKLVNNNNN